MYHENEETTFYESARDDFLQESRKIMTNLEEDEQELAKEKRKVLQQIEEVTNEKKQGDSIQGGNSLVLICIFLSYKAKRIVLAK